MGLVKGICYGNDAFPHPYNESNANSYQCTFGSDSTADYVAPLHGGQYMSPVNFGARKLKGSQTHHLVETTLTISILWV
jgi:hypothetical protein